MLPDKKVGEFFLFMKKKVLENIVKWIFLLCGIAAVGFVLCICLYLGDLRRTGDPGDRALEFSFRRDVERADE